MNNCNNNLYPKVLILSHNPMDKNFNMGRTVLSFFRDWDSNRISQFYLRPDSPSGEKCHCFYQFTDVDAIKSIFLRNHGGKTYTNYCKKNDSLYINDGKFDSVYRLGRKKKPFFCLLRDLVWSCSSWYNKKTQKWIDDFAPDIVFFAAGDYCFSYKMALKISKKRGIPMVVCFFDDFLLNQANNKGILRRYYHRKLVKCAKLVVDYSKTFITTSPFMCSKYESFFSVRGDFVFTSSDDFIKQESTEKKENRIVYLGNVGLGRYNQLIDFGNRLKSLNSKKMPRFIDVYSSVDFSLVPGFTIENGIIFHGPVSYQESLDIMKHSMAVLHVESFDENCKKRVMYSFSTKIADSLGSGTTLIAYGPDGIASIEYLKSYNCAIVIDCPDCFEEKMNILLNKNEVKRINEMARLAFKNNHSGNVNQNKIASIICNCIDNQKNENITN